MVDNQGEYKWFVARTRYFRHEVMIGKWLTEREIENFVPTERRLIRRKSGKSFIDKPLAPNLVFLKTSKEEACSLVSEARLPMRFIIDCATQRMMVVPEKEMSDFQRVFDCSLDEGGLIDKPLKLGEAVNVSRGPLEGVEGFVVEEPGKTYVVVGLSGMLWARAKVPRAWLVKS